jgi:bifunctional UDP-N-acetylglucosamine pyrophosphorylase/glucosamine-1-phosphate N-acetyltransferase
MTNLAIIILAAGAGTRMRSSLPKPLHEIGRAPLLRHVLRTAQLLDPSRIAVVVGADDDRVAEEARRGCPVTVVEQRDRLGTGHAVQCATNALEGFEGTVLVLYGDTPLLTPKSLSELCKSVDDGAAVAVLGFEARDPGSYGRLLAESEDLGTKLEAIVEAREASPAELLVRLCNSGVMAFSWPQAWPWLASLSNDNLKGEFYLTDLVAAARHAGQQAAFTLCGEQETLGVNDRVDLAAAEAAFQDRARREAMLNGATLIAPETVFFALDTVLGQGVHVGPNVVFGSGVRVEDGARIEAFSHLERCVVRSGAIVGPFARLRPGAEIGIGARVGNFVEVKNAKLGAGAKANHLAYLGDAAVGEGANIGAGTITCNFDGTAKHWTEIGAGAFIGSNSALVGPVTIGAGAYVASGSVITENVEDNALAFGRARQTNKPPRAPKNRI